MVLNLLLVLVLRMGDDVRNKLGEDVLEQFKSEGELDKVVAVVQSLQDVA